MGHTDTCCICNPELKINPHVCVAHKAEGRKLAAEKSIRYREAAAELYFRAKEKREATS